MEKFMYISILLFINAVFVFQLANCVNRKQNSKSKFLVAHNKDATPLSSGAPPAASM